MKFIKLALVVPVLSLLFSCSSSRITVIQKQCAPKSLRFIGEYDIPHALVYKNTTVGGLSGIDYDSAHDCYYFICDDRSAINPARYYTGRIFFSEQKIDSVGFTGMNYLLQPDGKPYPNNKQDKYNTPDPEAIRYDPIRKNLTWTNEGERILRDNEKVIADPSIRVIGLNGTFSDSFPLPENVRMTDKEMGPRQNGVFEGMSFANNYKKLFVNVEEPLYQDGPRADTVENNAFIRILEFDVKSKKNTNQYAYKLDPVAYPPSPATAYYINGVPDILWIGKNRLLVIERSYSTGRTACTIKVYEADISGATDIKDMPSLRNSTFKAAEKKLLLNMDSLGIYIDNIEGVSFGPTLSNGHKTLLFVADNNFSPFEKSQVLLFEISE